MSWAFTKEHVPNYLRGLDTYREHPRHKVIPPRALEADILGAAYHFGADSDSLYFQSWLREFVPAPDLREKLFFELKCLNVLSPVRYSIDLSAADGLEGGWGKYLLSIKDSGFRGRVFDWDRKYWLLFTTPILTGDNESSPDGRNDYELKPNGESYFSFFRAITVKSDLPDEYCYTFATHVAARTNCLNLVKELADSKDDLTRRDRSSYAGVLQGLTALHHAVYVIADLELIAYLLKAIPDYKTLLDGARNTVLHALACSVSTPNKADEAKLLAGELRQLQIYDLLYYSLIPQMPDAPLIEDGIGTGPAGAGAPSIKTLNLVDFFQAKNAAGQTALQVAWAAGNRALVAKLLSAPGADMTQISEAFHDTDKTKLHAGMIFQERFADHELQLTLVKRQIADVDRRMQALIEKIIMVSSRFYTGMKSLKAELASERAERQKETAFLYGRLEMAFEVMRRMMVVMEARGVAEPGFTAEQRALVFGRVPAGAAEELENRGVR